MLHLNSERLVDYAEGRLAGHALQFARVHLEECSPCTEELRKWSELFDLLQPTELQDPPIFAIRNSLAIFNIPKPVSRLREIVAQLVFDSFSEPLAFGVRGTAEAQQLLMQAEGIDLHLRVSYAPRAIAGQLLQRYEERFVSGARMSILKQGVAVETTLTDGLGEFRFRQVPYGKLQLRADLPSNIRLIGEFTVRGE